MSITETPEYRAGYEWASQDIPGWSAIYAEGEKRYRLKRHSYENHVRWEAFVSGAGQRLVDAGLLDEKEAVRIFTSRWERTLALYKQGADPNPPKPPGAGRTVHYMDVVTPGTFITIRTPYPIPRWKDILKALTLVMSTHGFMQKDISSIEGHLPRPDMPFNEDEMRFAERLDAAFRGDTEAIPAFWLYDWKDGEFVFVRKGAAWNQ